MCEFDKTGLEGRMFEGFAQTSDRRYIYLCNMQTKVTRWSKNAVEYFGLDGEYMLDVDNVWRNLIHPDDRRKYIEDITAVFERKKDKHSVDYRIKNKNGDYVVCSCNGVIIEGEPPLFIGTIENHSIKDDVDAITNLYNIYGFWKYIGDISNQKTEVIELLWGLNNFSDINSVYGFNYGDLVLKRVSECISECLDEDISFFRMDGVRFACCFKNKSVEYVKEFYKKIKKRLKYELYVNESRISISIAGGIVKFRSDDDIYSVQNGATYALEQSKYEKNGELVLFDNGVNEQKRKNLELVTAIRNSILNEFSGFYLCYQPLIDAKTEVLIGAEALLRWKKEPYGEVPPGLFIPWLENDPYFFELGNWILTRAMTEGKKLLDKYPNFLLHVNITYTQIGNSDFRNAVKRILQETEYPSKNLCLELTERCRHLEKNYLSKEIDYFNEMGIKIAIDDFGTGFSSLDILFGLMVDTMKFDRTFTIDIESNREKQAVIRNMSELAKDLNINVCLEGMETRDMIDFTKKYAIHSYQGYYFSKPIPMEEFIDKY